MPRSLLDRIQFRAGHLPEKELCRAALWSAALVIGAMLIPWAAFRVLPPYRLFGMRRYYLAAMAATTLPLMPGLVVGGGFGSLVIFLTGNRGPLSYWVEEVVGIGVNWYLYFLLLLVWFGRRGRKRLQPVLPQGTN